MLFVALFRVATFRVAIFRLAGFRRPRVATLCAIALGSGALIGACGSDADAPVDRPTFYQTKTPYRPRQDPATYEPPPAGFTAVYMQLIARHGSRGLANMKSDLVVYNMWRDAAAADALTDLGAKLGPDVLKLMRANFLLGYGVAGVDHPGYGNETHVGISEHTGLAARLATRRADLFGTVPANSRKIVVVSSGIDRAVDCANYFVASLLTARPDLTSAIERPPAPAGYPAGNPKTHPDGTNRFLLYFHDLVPATDLVTDPADPFYRTYSDSQAYQAYLDDHDLRAKQAAVAADPAARMQGRVALQRLFTRSFVDRIDKGELKFADTGTMSFTSDDGKFTNTLTGDGKATIGSLGDAGSYLYDLYSVVPAMKDEAGVDFAPYLPPGTAEYFAFMRDASDFYDKGPGITEKGDVTFRMAQILADDFFAEVDAIARGDLAHAAKLRFTHAEVMIPFASKMGLKAVSEQLPLASQYAYANNPWRGDYVSPMATNMQWDVFRNSGGTLIVRMLYNEKETDFKAACDGAQLTAGSHYYDYTRLKACYGHVAAQ
jgi:hypothetical protein